jgi:Flp pilus assembly CpaE family ATPase
VELDFQAGDMAFRLRLEPNRTVADALQTIASRSQFRECVSTWGQVDVLAAPAAGARLRREDLGRIEALLSSAQAAYPLVVADMPPAIYSSSRQVLACADEVCLVCTPEIASVHLAGRRVEELVRIGVPRGKLRLVLNRAGSHAWMGAGEVSQIVGLPVATLLSNDYRALDRAVLQGGVVQTRSPLGRQFEELGREVLAGRGRVKAAGAAA